MRKILYMVFIFFIPLFAPAQEKWQYVEFSIEFNQKGYFAQINKEDTVLKPLFWDESINKPKKFTRPVDLFNALGETGFELILIAERNAFPVGRDIVYTFKRRKAS